MRRGTNPSFTFRLKKKNGQTFSVSDVSDIRVTFKQGNTIVVEKKFKDCIFSGNTVSIELSQEETLRFDHGKSVRIQIKLKNAADGRVIPTVIKTVDCKEILNEEVL